MSQQGVTKMRLERLGDERTKTNEKLADLLQNAEDEQRELNDFEKEQAAKYRTKLTTLEEEIIVLSDDVERWKGSRDISRLVRESEGEGEGGGGTEGKRRGELGVYRTFAQYARDELLTKHPILLNQAVGAGGDPVVYRTQIEERLSRTVEHTLSSDIPGLIPPRHIAQIMDIIDDQRPVVSSARQQDLDRGSLTYPKISGRPEVLLQSSEKAEGGTADMNVTLETLTAETYIGGGNLSWQAVNWSSPDALGLWFDLAAEAYARQTEGAAAEVLETTVGIGTVGTASGRLGTAGTESFGNWRSAVVAGLAAIYSATSGRHRTNTLYLSAGRFFQLAALGSDQTLQMSPVGNMDVGSMTGTFFGLRVVGSYGFDQDTAIVGDSQALLVAETPGAPVQLRATEPTIGGFQVGVIGSFKAVVFDANRFYHLGTHL